MALLSEAEQALTSSTADEVRQSLRRRLPWPRLTSRGGQVPGGAAGEFLLGVVCRKSNRNEPAVAHFRKALALDPFCWSAFEELCALGDDNEAASLLNSAKCAVLRCLCALRCNR